MNNKSVLISILLSSMISPLSQASGDMNNLIPLEQTRRELREICEYFYPSLKPKAQIQGFNRIIQYSLKPEDSRHLRTFGFTCTPSGIDIFMQRGNLIHTLSDKFRTIQTPDKHGFSTHVKFNNIKQTSERSYSSPQVFRSEVTNLANYLKHYREYIY